MESMESNEQQHDSSNPDVLGTNGAEHIENQQQIATMSEDQSRDYHVKTQQLAQERRQLERERQEWEAQRYSQPRHESQQQAYQQNPNDPAVFNKLIEQFGFDGANVMLQSFNAVTQPMSQQLQYAQQMLQQTQAMGLMSELKAKGRELYGNEWGKSEKQVMERVLQYGIPIEDAWTLVHAKNLRQNAIDDAYKNQQQKLASNVATGSSQASPKTQQIGSFEDAFNAAKKELGY